MQVRSVCKKGSKTPRMPPSCLFVSCVLSWMVVWQMILRNGVFPCCVPPGLLRRRQPAAARATSGRLNQRSMEPACSCKPRKHFPYESQAVLNGRDAFNVRVVSRSRCWRPRRDPLDVFRRLAGRIVILSRKRGLRTDQANHWLGEEGREAVVKRRARESQKPCAQ
jgi:hypothetical protein